MAGLRGLLLDCDTLYTFQFGTLFGQLNEFRRNQELYMLVPEVVHSEHQRKSTTAPKYQAKALMTKRYFDNGCLHILNNSFLAEHGIAKSEVLDELWDQYDDVAQQLYPSVMDRGEAYCHAAAIAFEGLRVCSNDSRALRDAFAANYNLQPSISPWGLMVAMYMRGCLTENEAQKAVREIGIVGDVVPKSCRKKFSEFAAGYDKSLLIKCGVLEA